MKVSDWEKEEELQKVSAETATLKAWMDIQADLESREIPLYCEPPTEYGRFREGLRHIVRKGSNGEFYETRGMRILDLECNHCNSKILDTEPKFELSSNPPKFTAGCPGCGWMDYLPLSARIRHIT